jgi:hypothetical protein
VIEKIKRKLVTMDLRDEASAYFQCHDGLTVIVFLKMARGMNHNGFSHVEFKASADIDGLEDHLDENTHTYIFVPLARVAEIIEKHGGLQ